MTKPLLSIALMTLTISLMWTGTADAEILDPIISLAQDVFSDLGILVTIIGGIAIIVGVVAMMFGASNAWKVSIVGVLIVIGANAGNIVDTIVGL